MQSFLLILQVAILVGMSGIFSGLNISFMAIGLKDIRRKARLGNKDAKRVLPFRERRHLTLGSILFANVGVASATALVLGNGMNGWLAGFISTILLVVFGEVLPQALFMKSALRFVSFFRPLLLISTIITYPLSKPLQLFLDKILGKEPDILHSRRELGLIITDHLGNDNSDLDEGEVEIIQNALQLSEKKVSDIMTPLPRVYYLYEDRLIDAKTVDQIKEMGYSRIPILNRSLSKCVGVLLMKDMLDINFDDNPVLARDFTLHPTMEIGSRTALDTMFSKFTRVQSHLVVIERSDEIIGILTIEDLIEEILGREIIDETDHMKHRRN